VRVLAIALVVAVASITSVAFFADRVSRALVRDAHQLLGADLVLVSDHAWKRDVADEIARRGLARAEALNFISMARVGEASTLAGVKAVTDSYPLRGRLRIAPAPNAPDAPAAGGPPRGAVWLEERLVSALGAPVGASLRLGSAQLKVDAVLTLEPERGANFFNIAPRLIMNAADLPATGLVQPGSRIWYYLYAAGEPAAVAAFDAWRARAWSAASASTTWRAAVPKCAPRSSGRSAFSGSPRCWPRSSPAWRSRLPRGATWSATWTAAP
jgi:putative ABC transport system permease protein